MDLPTGVVQPSVSARRPRFGTRRGGFGAVRKPTTARPVRLAKLPHGSAAGDGNRCCAPATASEGSAQSATVGVVPVPKLLLQEIVAYYSKSPSKPGGISLDDQFVLPARIREIQVERGQAIIVQ